MSANQAFSFSFVLKISSKKHVPEAERSVEVCCNKKIVKFERFRSNAFLGFDSPPDSNIWQNFIVPSSPSRYVPLLRSRSFEHKYLQRFSPADGVVKSAKAPEDDDQVPEYLLDDALIDSDGTFDSDNTDCVPNPFKSLEEQQCDVKDVREANVHVDEKEQPKSQKFSDFNANLGRIRVLQEETAKLLEEVLSTEVSLENCPKKEELVQRFESILNLVNTDYRFIGKGLTEINQKLTCMSTNLLSHDD